MFYIELHACSAFSFLRGGSFPEQLAEVAAGLGMPALGMGAQVHLDVTNVPGAANTLPGRDLTVTIRL